MITTITFKNGVTLPTIVVNGGKEYYQNAQRETFDIHIPSEAITWDDLKELADDKDALSEITLTEVSEDGEGKEIKNSFVHYNYTIRMTLGLISDEVWSLKIAQKSDSELEIEKQSEMIKTQEDAIIELAEIVSSMNE